MSKDTSKYLSYAEAWRRIKRATDSGFHFETVTLCESIISDRLLSYVLGVNRTSAVNTHTPFARLISEWRRLAKSLPDHGGNDLGAVVDEWRKARNAIVHGLAKSYPGTPTGDLKPFLERAQQAAEQGTRLARTVSNWHRQQLTRKKTRT